MHIGQRVQRLRTQQAITQVELARRIGVQQSLISKLEHGVRLNPSAQVVIGLARTFGCTSDYLLGLHEEERPAGAPPR